MKNGFSIIELAIALVIIALLASLAIPQYQNYLLRTHVTTEYNVAKNPIEKAIQEYIHNKGTLPASGFVDLANFGFLQTTGAIHTSSSLATEHISKVDWNGSHISLQFISSHEQQPLQNKTIEIEVTSTESRVTFKVTGGTLAAHLLPK